MKDLSVKEAMEVLNVSESTIRRIMKRGELPNAYKKDRKNWIPQRDIDAYLERQQQRAESPAEPVPEPEPPSQEEEVREQAAPEVSEPAGVAKLEPAPEPEAPAAPVSVEEAPSVAAPVAPQEPVSNIAQPIEELETPEERPETPADIIIPSREEPTPPATQPAPPTTEAVEPYQEREQSFKWVMLQASILSANWLEKIFRKLRLALERYKAKSFPDSKDSQDQD